MTSIVAIWAAERATALRKALGWADRLDPARPVVEAALAYAGLSVCRLSPDDPLLAGADGVLDRQMEMIWIRDDLSKPVEAFLIGHELGHWFLHRHVGDFADSVAGAEGGDDGGLLTLQEADGYSPMQRRELEAGAFAAELTAPCSVVRDAFMSGATAEQIARVLGVSERVVVRQLVTAVLEQRIPRAEAVSPADACLTLDEPQSAAATAAGGPTAVIAGPGSGKTRMLAGRVLHLLAQGTHPSDILALTFSRNAAEELRQRLRQSGSYAAPEVGVFTLHGYGLELLRRYGDSMGRSPCPLVFDRVASLKLLEELIQQGHGGVWEYIDSPVRPLSSVLDVITRWKEAAIGPDAVDVTDPAVADLVQLYRRYEQALGDRDGLDYPDLIQLATRLLSAARERVPDLPEHVLVDELQDMDAASLHLIRLIAGDGRGLWAVGDPLQAIYAFRGADAVDAVGEAFESAAPGGICRLSVSYRASPLIARFIGALGRELGLDNVPVLEAADVAQSGHVSAAEADDEEAEARGIVQHIQAASRKGIRLGDQAVLCRTNSLAQDMARRLRCAGVPVNGPVTALDEACTRNALCAMAEAVGLPVPGFEVRGRPPWAELLREVRTVSAMLGRYLFGSVGAARELAGSEAAMGRQAMLWLWNLAEAVASRNGLQGVPDQVSDLIADVRRSVALGQDRLKCAPGARSDSVHLMTIHAAKGLEFDSVYVPRINVGVYPPRHRKPLVSTGSDVEQAPDCEARLLYVAASRARRQVLFSYCRRSGRRSAQEAPYMEAIRRAVCAVGGETLRWTCDGPTSGSPTPKPRDDGKGMWSISELTDYERCPYRYWLSRQHGYGVGSLYARFVGGMRSALRLLRESQQGDNEQAIGAALELLQMKMRGEDEDPGWLGLYTRRAREMLERASSEPTFRRGSLFVPFRLPLVHGCLTLEADNVYEDENGDIMVERWVYRAKRTNPPGGVVIGAMYRACRELWHDANIIILVRYLGSGECEPVPSPKDGGSHAGAYYDRLICGIRTGRFAPKPGDQCAWCAFLLVCPRTSDAAGLDVASE